MQVLPEYFREIAKPGSRSGGEGQGGGALAHTLFGWLKKIYFIIFYLTISISSKNKLTLHIILKYIKVSPTTNPTISDSWSLVLLLNGRPDFNREIMEFQLLFLFFIRS